MSTRVLNELKKNGYIKIKNFFSQKKIKNIQNEFFSLSKKLYNQNYNKEFEKNPVNLYLTKGGKKTRFN